MVIHCLLSPVLFLFLFFPENMSSCGSAVLSASPFLLSISFPLISPNFFQKPRRAGSVFAPVTAFSSKLIIPGASLTATPSSPPRTYLFRLLMAILLPIRPRLCHHHFRPNPWSFSEAPGDDLPVCRLLPLVPSSPFDSNCVDPPPPPHLRCLSDTIPSSWRASSIDEQISPPQIIFHGDTANGHREMAPQRRSPPSFFRESAEPPSNPLSGPPFSATASESKAPTQAVLPPNTTFSAARLEERE